MMKMFHRSMAQDMTYLLRLIKRMPHTVSKPARMTDPMTEGTIISGLSLASSDLLDLASTSPVGIPWAS